MLNFSVLPWLYIGLYGCKLICTDLFSPAIHPPIPIHTGPCLVSGSAMTSDLLIFTYIIPYSWFNHAMALSQSMLMFLVLQWLYIYWSILVWIHDKSFAMALYSPVPVHVGQCSTLLWLYTCSSWSILVFTHVSSFLKAFIFYSSILVLLIYAQFFSSGMA